LVPQRFPGCVWVVRHALHEELLVGSHGFRAMLLHLKQVLQDSKAFLSQLPCAERAVLGVRSVVRIQAMAFGLSPVMRAAKPQFSHARLPERTVVAPPWAHLQQLIRRRQGIRVMAYLEFPVVG
jgi:hypothetical protein